MVHQPRWLSLFAIAVVGMLVLVACTPATGPTASPARVRHDSSKRDSRPHRRRDGRAERRAQRTSPATRRARSPSESPGESPSTEPPTGLAVPARGRGHLPDGDTPGEFNGEDYTGNVESIQAPDDLHGRLQPVRA